MKLLNKTLVAAGCAFFSLHFGLLIALLTVCYFCKSVYYKLAKKGEFKVNPLKHANPEVLLPTSNICVT